MGARKRLGFKDQVIELIKAKIKPSWMTQEEYDVEPNSLSIRELHVGRKILITMMLNPKVTSSAELKALNCHTPEMNEKGVWVYFLAYNLIRLLMDQSYLLADILPRQLSLKHSM